MTRHIDSVWQALLTDLTTESGSFWTEAVTVCDEEISVVCHHINFNSYIMNLGPPVELFKHYACVS
jgi:hypothetical protein